MDKKINPKQIKVSGKLILEMKTQLLKMEKAGKVETQKEFTEKAIEERIAKLKESA